MIFFPYDIHFILQSGIQRTKAQIAVAGRVNDLVKPDRVSKSFINEKGCVEDQVVGGGDVELVRFPSEPLGKGTALRFLLGEDQRDIVQIAGAMDSFSARGESLRMRTPQISW